MKIRIIALLLVVLTAFVFAGCSDEDDWIPAGMKLASTDAVDYTIYVPESWTVDISTGVISAYVSNTDRSNVTVTAYNLSDDNSTLTLDEYWAKYEADLLLTFPDMTYVDASETAEAENTAETETETEAEVENIAAPISTVIDGTPANKYYYKATITGIGYQFMQIVAIRGGVAYIITYTSTPAVFDNHILEVDKIVENFKFAQ